MAARKTAFLDRDGTLIWDRPGFYLRHPGQLRLYRGTVPALRMLRKAGYRLVVVTNQSGIGRGFLDRAMLARIHALLRRKLARSGVRLDGIYFCPHAPDVPCRCRKPSPHLARKAARELGLNLKGAVMIGDKRADVEMARRLGIASIHLGTGHGRLVRAERGASLGATHRSRDILGAAKWLTRHR